MKQTSNHRKTHSRIINQPLAYYLCGQDVKDIHPGRVKGRPLPATLVIPPGIYRVHGHSYRLVNEGLYRFLHPAVDNQQRVVYRSDPWALVSALSWLSSHGNRDNLKNISDYLKIAMREKLIVTCSYMSGFGQHIFSEQGIPARVVQAVTLDKLNNYNNGHTLLEIKLGGKWTLVDLDIKFLFRRNGRRLSLLEAVEAVAEDNYQLEPLAQAVGITVSNFVRKGYDYGLWMETNFFSHSAIRNWYRRIMMIPLMPKSDRPTCFTARTAFQRRKAKKYYPNSVYLPRPDFIRRFYREQ